jgi:hypothetical protein
VTEEFELLTDEQGRLVLRRPGQEDKVDVRVRRSFPWSRPSRFISVRDAEGKELLLIDDLDQLDPARRKGIEDWLNSTSFIPRITHVDHVDARFGHQDWKVQTDRGPVEFRVQEREDIRFLPDGRFRLKDADGNVYELPSAVELDEHSRRAIGVIV